MIEEEGLMGSAEAAERIGIPVQNLNTLVGAPKPVVRLRATRVWLASEIEAFAEEYQSRERVVSAKAERKGTAREPSSRNGSRK
jgi:hypothetical protein